MKKNITHLLPLIIVLLLLLAPKAYALVNKDEARTKVGNPVSAAAGWPTTGTLTQGPQGAFDHVKLTYPSLDIGSQAAPPVSTTFDGVVSAVHNCEADGDCSRGWGGYGNSVEVKSSDNPGTVLFGHFSSINVSVGQTVKKGDVLGTMGTTGVSTGIHLHWEFRGIPLAPPYIPTEVSPSNCDPPGIPCSPSSI